MKVLLSAYACEPGRGSEPGVGWNWACEIANLGNEVWVLTRKNNREIIEEHCKNTKPANVNFIYYDLPSWLTWWKKGGRGVYLYYLLWQIGAFFKAKNSHREINYDCVQHITFVTVRQPSFMGSLGIPFILGPVGGGESAPYELRKNFSLKGWIKDMLRDVANSIIKYDPMMHLTFKTADRIYVTSEQTKSLIPKWYQGKVDIQLAIGIEDTSVNLQPKEPKLKKHKLLYVGRFESWKGMALGLKAFAGVLKEYPDTVLTMVGKGPDFSLWYDLALKLNVNDNVIWVDWVEQDELAALYQQHDIFLFPSLHDSGGMVVLEAMSYGLPVVCLDLGGPGVIVDNQSGLSVGVQGRSELCVVKALENSLLTLMKTPPLLGKLSLGSKSRAADFSWQKVILGVYAG